MSPVEPSPVVMGTMGSPSTDGGLGFLPERPAAFNSGGANRQPSAATKERRLQLNFTFIDTFLSTLSQCVSAGGGRSEDSGAAHDLDQRIPGDPFEGHA